jgi:hypothetical protein
MMATAEAIRVKLRQGFAGTGWSSERGDEIEVPLADARRMVTRGLAERPEKGDDGSKQAFDRAMKMNATELAEARRVDHKSRVSDHLAIRLGLRKQTQNEED